jgi:ribosomal-protein-alanine N-acetyltransferase
MTETDLEQVLALEAVSFLTAWKREHFINEMESPLSFPLVARAADGTVAGYICPMLVLDEGQILNVAVRPEYRGRGIGGLLMEAALNEFGNRKASFVALEVRPSNRAAISLYTRCGFVTTGRRKAYYENGEDALLMEYEFARKREG